MKRCLLSLVICFASVCAWADWSGKTYSWTGKAGDGKWSTAGNWKVGGNVAETPPAETDKALFGSGKDVVTVDAGATDGITYLTIAVDFAGSIVLDRDFAVWHEYKQYAGTFTCGKHNFQVGRSGGVFAGINTLGNFYLYNRCVFNGPVDNEFRWMSRSHQVCFQVADEASFDCSKTDFKFRVASQGGSVEFTCANRTFRTFELFSGDDLGARSTIKWHGTNTVLQTFTHGGGIFTGTKAVDYGESAFYLEGDFVLKDYPQGMSGQGGMHFILTNALDQSITTSIATDRSNATAGFLIDKPAGTVTVKGERFNVTDSGGNRHYGFVVKCGTVDMSGVKWFALSNYNTEFQVWDEASVVWPDHVKISNFQCHLRLKNQTFKHLLLHSSDSTLDFGYATTNTVTGWLDSNGFGFNGINDTVRYPESSQTGVKPVLRLLGPGINVMTNASTYGGFLNSLRGEGELWLCSDENQVITCHDSRLYLPAVVVDKPVDKSVDMQSDDGIISLRARGSGNSGGHLKIFSGTLYGPTRRINIESYGSRFEEGENGRYVCRGATVNFTGWDGHFSLHSPIAGVIQNLTDASGVAGNGITVEKGTVLTVTNRFEGVAGNLKSGGTGARMDLSGDFAITGLNFSESTPNCPVRFTGDREQRVSIIENGRNTTGQITVAKTGGRVVLDTDVNFVKDSPEVVLESGLVDVNGHHVTMSGKKSKLTLGGGASLGVPAGTTVNADPWVSTKGTIIESGTAENPFVVRLTNGKAFFDGPGVGTRVNVFGCNSLSPAHDSERFAAQAERPLSARRSNVLFDEPRGQLYLIYALRPGLSILVR